MNKLMILALACGCQAPELATGSNSTAAIAEVAPVAAEVPEAIATAVELVAEVEPVAEVVLADVPEPIEPEVFQAPVFTQVAAWQSLKAIPKDFEMELTVTVVQHPQMGPMKSYRFRLDHTRTATALTLSGNSKSTKKLSKLTTLATLGRLADIGFPDQYMMPDMGVCTGHESRVRHQLDVILAGESRKLSFVTGCGVEVPGVSALVQQVRNEAIDLKWFEEMDGDTTTDPTVVRIID